MLRRCTVAFYVPIEIGGHRLKASFGSRKMTNFPPEQLCPRGLVGKRQTHSKQRRKGTLRTMKSPFDGNVGGTADYIRPLLFAGDFLMHEYPFQQTEGLPDF